MGTPMTTETSTADAVSFRVAGMALRIMFITGCWV